MHDWTKDWYTTWYVLREWWKWLLIISVAVFLLLRAAPNHAYVILQHDGYDAAWEDPTVEMNIQLSSCPDVSKYTFYGPCRPGSTRRAMQDWNDVGSRYGVETNFRFVEQTGVISDVCNHNDGINTIGWSDNFCGERLSGKRAARTISTYRYENGVPVVAERDIILDLNYPWTKQAFQITILHELGHIVGLGHPNDHGQNVLSIMNNPIVETAVTFDDLEGLIALYGRKKEEPEPEMEMKGVLEIPSPSAYASGIGIISGWVCDADHVEAIIRDPNGEEVDISPVSLPYGSERLDTENVCGDTHNGFAAVMNWQRLKPAKGYTIEVFADGSQISSYTFHIGGFGKIPGFGEDFLRIGFPPKYLLVGFPHSDYDTLIIWQNEQQGFAVIKTQPTQ